MSLTRRYFLAYLCVVKVKKITLHSSSFGYDPIAQHFGNMSSFITLERPMLCEWIWLTEIVKNLCVCLCACVALVPHGRSTTYVGLLTSLYPNVSVKITNRRTSEVDLFWVVCGQNISRTSGSIQMKLSGIFGLMTGTNWLDFGINPVPEKGSDFPPFYFT